MDFSFPDPLKKSSVGSSEKRWFQILGNDVQLLH